MTSARGLDHEGDLSIGHNHEIDFGYPELTEVAMEGHMMMQDFYLGFFAAERTCTSLGAM